MAIKSVWDKFRDMLDTSSYPDGTRVKAPSEKKPILMILPNFEDEKIVNSYSSHLSSFDYKDADNVRQRETYKERVGMIVDNFFDNFSSVEAERSGSDVTLKYNGFKIRVDGSYVSLCSIRVMIGNEDFKLPMSKYEIARTCFLSEFLIEEQIKKKDAQLDAMLGVVTKNFQSTKLKKGMIRISEEEILDSLLQTHPQHFI